MRALEGTLVLDLSRMLPGAVLTRSLVDLGARVLKIEDPGVGDPMRSAPPIVEGVGAGFRAFMRGVESVCIDLRSPDGIAALRRLAAKADVLVESFRPGTMARWGLGVEALAGLNPGLVTVSLAGYPAGSPDAARVAHDLNLVARSGLMSQLPSGMPLVQIADVTTGLLASNAVLAALLARARTGRGQHIDQALARGPLPFLTWAWADASAARLGFTEPALLGTLLAGDGASYTVYRCADGLELVVGAIEPKFWAELCVLLDLPELTGDGLAVGDTGAAVRNCLAERFASQPRDHWLALLESRNLPVSAVNDLATGFADPAYASLHGASPLPGGGHLANTAPWVAGASDEGLAPAPALGQHTAAVLAEFVQQATP